MELESCLETGYTLEAYVSLLVLYAVGNLLVFEFVVGLKMFAFYNTVGKSEVCFE